jgi:hypothetical protein
MQALRNVALALAVLVSGASAAQRNGFNNSLDSMHGHSLTEEAAAELEERLERDASDVKSRRRLIAYYSTQFRDPAARDKQCEHALWLIEHAPELADSSLFSLPYLVDEEISKRAKELWERHIRDRPEDGDVIWNAAAFYTLREPSRSEELLLHGEELEPEKWDWPHQLGQLFMLSARRRGADLPLRYALAAGAFERALERIPKGSKGQSLMVRFPFEATVRQSLAVAALWSGDLERAGTQAEWLIDEGAVRRGPLKTVDGGALHKGHLVLGHIALEAGDVPEAESRLLAAGRIPGGPSLGSFGPNMRLARDLLEHERNEVVLEYFELCSVFWKRPELDTWAEAVRAGEMPDFGANLIY